LIEAVTDDEILGAYRLLAECEGVFCEPASAAGVAGILKLKRENRLPQNARIVCILTGNGLKDPDNAIAQAEIPKAIPATMDALTKTLDL
jgi:threonine synthase